jgi:hypothetical protein
MKFNTIIVMMMVLLLTMGVNGLVQAKVKSIMTRRDFERAITRNNISVVLFYVDQKGDRRNKDLFRMYEDVSSEKAYDDADVIFLKINAGRRDMADLAALYGVSQMPCFIFFNNGKRLVNDQGKPLSLNGFATRVDVQSFIDTHYGVNIREAVAKKDENRAARINDENESWKPYFYPRDIFVRSYEPAEAEANME